jgi:hypothetical protein
MKPRALFAAAVIVMAIGAVAVQRSIDVLHLIADAFSHPWVAFGAGVGMALIVVAIAGVLFIGACANAFENDAACDAETWPMITMQEVERGCAEVERLAESLMREPGLAIACALRALCRRLRDQMVATEFGDMARQLASIIEASRSYGRAKTDPAKAKVACYAAVLRLRKAVELHRRRAVADG